jgi:hypothetical protein
MPTPDKFDLILISDSGKKYLVKMKTVGENHEPTSLHELKAGDTNELPDMLREEGVTLAILPDDPGAGGCTCILLNLESFENVPKPDRDPNFENIIKAKRALREGATIDVSHPDKKKSKLEGVKFTPKPKKKGKAKPKK